MEAGDSILLVGGLPLALDDASVQAKGRGLPGVKLQGVTVRRKFQERTSNDLIRGLEDSLQQIDDQIRILNDEVALIGLRRDFLLKMKDALVLPEEAKRSGPGIEQVTQLYQLYGSELKELIVREQAIVLEKRSLNLTRAKQQEEFARARGFVNNQATEKEVLIALTSPAAGALTIDLQYTIAGAGWSPLYDVYAQVQDRTVEWVYNGMVRQRTGEDWNDVQLFLSTARPDSQIKMGELPPWWIRAFEQQSLRSIRPGAAAGALMSAPALAAPAPAQAMAREEKAVAEVQLETSTINTTGLSTIYQLKLPITIPSDGEVHRTTITVLSLEGSVEHVSTPKLNQAVFLKAKLNNNSGGPILAGPVNLFRDGDFIGNSQLTFVGVDAEIELFLGIDDGIKIERKLLVDKKEAGGVLQKMNRFIRKFQIAVENFKSTDETVLIYDQIPVSQSGDVTVSNVQYSQPPKSVNKETGEVIWSLALPKRGKRELTLDFTVEAPEGKIITGL